MPILNSFEQKFKRRQFSYMMVTVLALLKNLSPEGTARLENVAETFRDFYLTRIRVGKVPEKDNAIMSRVESLSIGQIASTMLKQPLTALRELIHFHEETNTLRLSEELFVELNWKTEKELRKLAYEHLYHYYKQFSPTQLTVEELNVLEQGHAVSAIDVAAVSGQNQVKGIHPIENDQKCVIILCTLNGEYYPNEWLSPDETSLKYYLEGRTQKDGTKSYNEMTKSNQAVILSKEENYPIHVFTRNKKGELYHYEGRFVFDRVETEESGDKYFVLNSLNMEGKQEMPQDVAREILNGVQIDLSVPEVVTHINNYVAARGFTFEEDLIKNFYLSLKTKPFVILAGISGTGKSQLGELVAAAVGATVENGRYKLIPVRPDWNDSADLLGYYNLQGKFVAGPLVKVIEDAMQNPSKPYFVCLDEMNLARVEYYFSEFLSIIESRKLVEGRIVSHAIGINGHVHCDQDEDRLYFPENLYVIGTVNMDETTHAFSRKVLDRANTIELTEVNLSKYPEVVGPVEAVEIDNSYFKSDYLLMKDCYVGNEAFIQEKVQILEEINSIIACGGFQVGYRVRDEFCFYLLYNKEWGLLTEEQAVDFQILQKILPRIQGSDGQVKDILEELERLFTERYPASLKKVQFMLGRLESDGFTSFWP